MKINIVCRPSQSGVGRHAQFFYQHLRLEKRDQLNVCYVNPDNKNELAQTIYAGCEDDVTILFVTYSHDLVKLFKGRKILWCAFESDRIPSQLIHLIKAYDKVWVPSHWGQQVMIKNGLAQEFVASVPEGVDTKVFYPKARPHKDFIFLSVAKYEKRKGLDELICAYREEFPCKQYPSVALWLKADFPLFPDRIQNLRDQLADDNRIHIVDENRSDLQMAELYNSVDAFVYPSRAEGFGLTGLEALVCGVPTIALNYSGQSEYLDTIPSLFYSIDYELENIDDLDFDYFYKQLYAGEPYGQWAKPLKGSLRQGMRDVYTHPHRWREKGMHASSVLSANFDWKISVEKALVKLGEID